MRPKILVIGCGIVGNAAVHQLKTLNVQEFCDLSVLDVFPTSKNVSTLRDLDGSPAAWTPRSRISGYPGGNLNWGGNSSLVILDEPDAWDSNFISNIENLRQSLVELGFPSLRLTVLKSDCTKDSFQVRENRKISNKLQHSVFRPHENLELISGIALKINKLENQKFEIEFRDSENARATCLADYVLICAGVIGTQELLENSRLLSNPPEHILDHPSFKLGVLRFGKLKLAKRGLFGWNRVRILNQKLCFTYLDREKKLLSTLRLFPCDVVALGTLFRSLPNRIKSAEYALFLNELLLWIF